MFEGYICEVYEVLSDSVRGPQASRGSTHGSLPLKRAQARPVEATANTNKLPFARTHCKDQRYQLPVLNTGHRSSVSATLDVHTEVCHTGNNPEPHLIAWDIAHAVSCMHCGLLSCCSFLQMQKCLRSLSRRFCSCRHLHERGGRAVMHSTFRTLVQHEYWLLVPLLSQ
jgi:hypothetical protein